MDGRRLAVEWWANLQTNDGPLTLAGEFLLLFADTGECRELREYWVRHRGASSRHPGGASKRNLRHFRALAPIDSSNRQR